MGKSVREDVINTVQGAKEQVSACYENALKRNRNLRGVIELSFTAAPESGRFGGIEVARDEVGDDEMTSCLQSKVGALALSKPTKTTVSITYPFSFAPAN